MSDSTSFTNAWLGYDVPYEAIEFQPVVQFTRDQGVKKRIQKKEYHVTVGYFPNISLDELTTFLKKARTDFEKPLEKTQIIFDRYGSIAVDGGHYVYFSPSTDSAKEMHFLKSRISEVNGIGTTSPSTRLHLSIGGKDPFEDKKEPQADLPSPISVEGTLMFVGKQNDQFYQFIWSDSAQAFIEQKEEPTSEQATKKEERPKQKEPEAKNTKKESTVSEKNPSETKQPLPIHTIAIFPKIQIDTLVAIFLLKRYGENLFPGAKEAKVVFMSKAPTDKPPEQTEKEGTLLVDLGGMFDHHRSNIESGKRQDCVSTLIAKYLDIDQKKYLSKLLQWAKRDDLEGKGTISQDGIDRTFGLSGIVSMLNRELKNEPYKILKLILPLISHHVAEQQHRVEGLPKLYEELEAKGKAKKWKLKQGRADLKAALAQCDDIGMAGWLKAVKRMDLVVQRAPTGHTNIITRQERSIDLRPLIAQLRKEEAKRINVPLSLTKDELEAPGKIEEVPMWYYDDAANTLQNGGIDPGDTPPTQLGVEEVIAIINESIPNGVIGHLKRKKEKELQK